MKYILLCIALAMVSPVTAIAQGDIVSKDEFMTAKVLDVESGPTDIVADDLQRTVQHVTLEITSGPDKGKGIAIDNGVLKERDDMKMRKGESVVLRSMTMFDGSIRYVPAEKYRLPALLWLAFFFFACTIALSGWVGVASIGGLLMSIAVLALYIVPTIASGANPMLTSFLGSCGIACTSLYLAHGCTRRTSVALLSTLITLAIAAILSVIFVSAAKLFGMGSEESLYFQSGALAAVNLRGLLLGGMIIGCLGVLDDVTTAQTAAVDEVRKANPALSPRELWAAGISVGKEHIASLINTIALAYVGVSLPLLLLFSTGENYPIWVTLNSEFIAEEIVRTLVGSSALLFAVPISTFFAVLFLRGSYGDSGHMRGVCRCAHPTHNDWRK